MGMARTRLVEICQHGSAKLSSTPLRSRLIRMPQRTATAVRRADPRARPEGPSPARRARLVRTGRRDDGAEHQVRIRAAPASLAGTDSQSCRGILNLCCPYTSQEEIATAIKRTAEACAAGKLAPSCVLVDLPSYVEVLTSRGVGRDITDEAITANLYTSASPPLDILIRTSGVSRLSDFLLWQVRQLASCSTSHELLRSRSQPPLTSFGECHAGERVDHPALYHAQLARHCRRRHPPAAPFVPGRSMGRASVGRAGTMHRFRRRAKGCARREGVRWWAAGRGPVVLGSVSLLTYLLHVRDLGHASTRRYSCASGLPTTLASAVSALRSQRSHCYLRLLFACSSTSAGGSIEKGVCESISCSASP